MRDQRGYTLVEMVVAVAIIFLVSGMATLAGVGFLTSARVSRGASQLADNVSLAREQAIAKYQRWRIRFIQLPGSHVAREYVLEYCDMPVGSGSSACTTAWTPWKTMSVGEGTGILLTTGAVTVTELRFNRTGQFEGNNDAELRVCGTQIDATGSTICRPGSVGRLVRIRRFSGIIET